MFKVVLKVLSAPGEVRIIVSLDWKLSNEYTKPTLSLLKVVSDLMVADSTTWERCFSVSPMGL